MSVFTLIKANLRNKKSNVISVVIFMALISFLMTAVINIAINSMKRAEFSLAEAGNGNIILWYIQMPFTEEVKEKVEENSLVEKTDAVKSITTANTKWVTIHKTEAESYMCFQIYDLEKHPYPLFEEGRKALVSTPRLPQKGDIYLPITFRGEYACEIGDKVVINTSNHKKEFRIAGFVEELTMGNPLMSGIKNVFISKADYDTLCDYHSENESEFMTVTGLHVYKKSDCTLDDNAFIKKINEETAVISTADVALSKSDYLMYSTMITNLFAGILIVFGILLFVVSIIVIAHNISTTIEMDYVSLGVLKSQGFTTKELRNTYLYQYLGSQLIGIVIGFAGGIGIAKLACKNVADFIGLMPESKTAYAPIMFINIVIILIGIIVITIKTKSIGRISPMRAISGGRETIYFKPRLQGTIGKKGLSIRLMFRALASNKKQYVGSGVIIAALVYFLATGAAALTCFNEENMLKDFYGYVFDLNIDYKQNEELKEQVEKKIKEKTDILSCEKFINVYFNINGTGVYGNIVDKTSPNMFTNVYKGREPKYKNEIIITESISKKMGINIGDTVQLEYDGQKKDFIVTGLNQSAVNAGGCIGLLWEGFERYSLDEEIAGYNYILSTSNKEEIAEITNILNKEYGNKIEVADLDSIEKAISVFANAASSSQLVTAFFSILFVLITSYMVCSKVFLKEQYDYGIYKALGFTTNELRLQFALRFLAVAIIGAIIGTLLSILTSNQVISSMLSNVGITNFTMSFTFHIFIQPVLLLTIAFFIFSYFIAGKIKKIEIKNLILE